jgi:hypothetical protein
VVESVEEVEGSVVTAAEVLEEVLLSAEVEEVGSELELDVSVSQESVRGSQWRLQAEKTEKTERSRVVRVSAERGVGGMEEALGGWFGRRGALVGVVRVGGCAG